MIREYNLKYLLHKYTFLCIIIQNAIFLKIDDSCEWRIHFTTLRKKVFEVLWKIM